MSTSSKILFFPLVLLCSTFLGSANATSIVIDASEFISYQAFNQSLTTRVKASLETSLLVGSDADIVLGSDLTFVQSTYRHAIVFQTGSFLNQQVTGATLEIDNPIGSYNSPDLSEVYRVYDAQAVRTASTPFVITNAGATCNGNPFTPVCNEIYDDLGSGNQYASQEITTADDGTTLSLSLDQIALEDLNNATGSFFALGGALTSTPTLGHIVPNSTNPFESFIRERVFDRGMTFKREDVRLVLELADDLPPPQVPEPSTMLLMGSGLVGLLGWRRLWRD